MRVVRHLKHLLLETQQTSPDRNQPIIKGLWQEICSSEMPLRLRVRGTSMVPALWPGEMITVQPVTDGSLVVGDIVVIARDGHLVVHRLQRIIHEGKGDLRCLQLVACGDTSLAADDPVQASELVGRVSSVYRFGSERRPALERNMITCGFAWAVRRSDLLRRTVDRIAGLPGIGT